MAARSSGRPWPGTGRSSASRLSSSTERISRAHTEKGNCPALGEGASWGAAGSILGGGAGCGSVSSTSA